MRGFYSRASDGISNPKWMVFIMSKKQRKKNKSMLQMVVASKRDNETYAKYGNFGFLKAIFEAKKDEVWRLNLLHRQTEHSYFDGFGHRPKKRGK